MLYVYRVVIDINEDDYERIHRHQPGTAGALFRDEIQSNLESCPEPNEVLVTLEGVHPRGAMQVAAYDINHDPRD